MTTTIKYFFYSKKVYGSHFFLKIHPLRKNRIFQFCKKTTWFALLKFLNYSKISGRTHDEIVPSWKTIGIKTTLRTTRFQFNEK